MNNLSKLLVNYAIKTYYKQKLISLSFIIIVHYGFEYFVNMIYLE